MLNHINGLKAFLQRYVDFIEQRKLNKDPAGNEFQLIKQQALEDRKKIPSIEGAKEVNKHKNRYKDILPYDYSRVVLPSEDSKDGSDYINANFIKDGSGNVCYIAAQAPMATTVNDFWRMIWTNDVKLVIMACKLIELGKPRCERYWPDDGQECWFNDIKVTLNGSRDYTKTLTLRDLKLQRNGKEKYLTQMHYTDWPDHGAPETTEPIIQLINLARKKHPDDNPPIVVHCSAGCGRTGAIIAIDYARKLLNLKKAYEVDVLSIVLDLRRQRPSMVQAKEQLEFLYEVIRELVSTELSKYTEPNEEETSNYVNINFVQKNVSGSKQNLKAESPRLAAKERQQMTGLNINRNKSLYNSRPKKDNDPKVIHEEVTRGYQAESCYQGNSRNQDKLLEQIKQQHHNQQNKDSKPSYMQQMSVDSLMQLKSNQLNSQGFNDAYLRNNTEKEKAKTTVIPPNTLLSTAASKLKDAEINDDVFQVLEPTSKPFEVVETSDIIFEKIEATRPYGKSEENCLAMKPDNVQSAKLDTNYQSVSSGINSQAVKSQLPSTKCISESKNGIKDNYAVIEKNKANSFSNTQLNNPYSSPPGGVIVPYAIVDIEANHVEQPQKTLSSTRKLTSDSAPPLPERTPESFIIVAPTNEKTEVNYRQNSCRDRRKHLPDISNALNDPYVLPQNLLDNVYSQQNRDKSKQDYSKVTDDPYVSPQDISVSPTSKNWNLNKTFNKILPNNAKKPSKTDSALMSFDNYGFNSLAFPNRISAKPKGMVTQPSHWKKYEVKYMGGKD
ncbi:tyrosine-protein phosphatase non-receptor type 22 isoform X1 [Hydra vulgaris]|uniref:tyrosine-protein phosphatase non-receptor type 22 isoform X1 n=1 Tax=Hydra vulgaris TaxID=6087 RepID=UPI001F5ECFC9|nr:tyrosine-protein phosphatase non-receptor type 22 isoform X1 [Hydra vulgaris]